jgi:hypothetical protein
MQKVKHRHLWIYFVILLAGYIYATPYITLFLIKRSIESRSAQNIERFVDFSNVRDSLKSQLTNHLQEEASKDQDSGGFAQLVAGMGTALGSTVIDTLVQPNNVQKWLNGEKAQGIQDMPDLPSPSSLTQPDPNLSLRYTSFDTFEVGIGNSQAVRAITLERRNIVNWKVVSVILDKSLFVNQRASGAQSSVQNNIRKPVDQSGEVYYVDSGPGSSGFVMRQGLLYYSDENGISSKPEGKPEVISQNILKLHGVYYCLWEGYAQDQAASIDGPWVCTANGLVGRNSERYVY